MKFFENNDWAGKIFALSEYFHADIYSDAAPPNVALFKKVVRLFVFQ